MDQTFSLKGKVVIVTGGTGVLGKSIVDGIANAGGAVGILGRNRKIAEERATRINRYGGKAIALCADVTDKNDLINARKLVLDTYGRIDGLVNAAGGNIAEAVVQDDQDIFSLNMGALRQVMEINLWGTILPTQVFGESMCRTGGGSIVNISSMAAKRAITRILGYSMAKASVECFTQWFALELGRRYTDSIRMNAVAPGFFLTEQNRTLLTEENGEPTQRGQSILQNTPFKRWGEPHELKGAVLWLLSNASKFVTGATIQVDGGFSINSGV